MGAGGLGLEIRAFSDETEADAVSLVNATTAGWPYSRSLDSGMLAYWRRLGERFQPHNMLVAYRAGRPRAFLHGERDGEDHYIRFLAMLPDALEEGLFLLAAAESAARADGVKQLVGPCFWGFRFYGGYVVGLEPYHPHWYALGTDAFLRAGYRVAHNAIILVALPETAARPGPVPDGYEVAEAAPTLQEFGAEMFRYAARFDGSEVATCGGRFYPLLKGVRGGPIGQVGYVGTETPHRGKGLATLMTAMCLRRLFAMGASEVLIATGLDNFPALRAYEKAGFQRRHHIMEWARDLIPSPSESPDRRCGPSAG